MTRLYVTRRDVTSHMLHMPNDIRCTMLDTWCVVCHVGHDSCMRDTRLTQSCVPWLIIGRHNSLICDTSRCHVTHDKRHTLHSVGYLVCCVSCGTWLVHARHMTHSVTCESCVTWLFIGRHDSLSCDTSRCHVTHDSRHTLHSVVYLVCCVSCGTWLIHVRHDSLVHDTSRCYEVATFNSID